MPKGHIVEHNTESGLPEKSSPKTEFRPPIDGSTKNKKAHKQVMDDIYQLRSAIGKIKTEKEEDKLPDISTTNESADVFSQPKPPCQEFRFQLLTKFSLGIFDCYSTLIQLPYAYIFGNLQSATPDPCLMILNIADVENPFIVKTISTTEAIRNAVLIGNIVIGIDTSSNLLWTFDLGDPFQAFEVGSIDIGHQARDIATQGRFVYAIGPDDLTIVDYSEYNIPKIVDNNNDASWNLRAITVDNWYAYVADFTGTKLRIFDITSGSSSLVSSTNLGIVDPRGILYNQGYVYVCGGDDAELESFDVKDVSAPDSKAVINMNDDSEAFWEHIALAGDRLLITGDGDMYAININDPDNPRYEMKYDAGPSATRSFYKGAMMGRNFFMAGLGTVAGAQYALFIFRLGGFFCDYINTSNLRVEDTVEVGNLVKGQKANFAQDVVAGSLTITGEQGGITTSRKSFLTFADFIADDSSNGLVLLDGQSPPHYWRVTIDPGGAGTLVITDLGTTRPD